MLHELQVVHILELVAVGDCPTSLIFDRTQHNVAVMGFLLVKSVLVLNHLMDVICWRGCSLDLPLVLRLVILQLALLPLLIPLSVTV